jgi:hypothetical protein
LAWVQIGETRQVFRIRRDVTSTAFASSQTGLAERSRDRRDCLVAKAAMRNFPSGFRMFRLLSNKVDSRWKNRRRMGMLRGLLWRMLGHL